MDNRDRPKFAQILYGLCSAFRVEASEPMAEGYWLGLEDLQLDQVKTAITKAFRECKFMPVPAQLRELIPESKKLAAPYHAPIPRTLCTFHESGHNDRQSSPTGGAAWCAECRHVKALRSNRSGGPEELGNLLSAWEQGANPA